MIIPDPPCIENKCLLIPVCKNKQVIYCDILRDYIDEVYSNIEPTHINDLMIKLISIFTHAITVYPKTDKFQYSPYIIRIRRQRMINEEIS